MAGCRRPDGKYEMLQVPEKLGEIPPPLLAAFLAEAEASPVGGGYGGDLRELSVEDAWAHAPWTDSRKNAVAGLAWALSIRGGGEEEVMETCLRFAVECCEPPLDEGIVQRKVEYTWARAAAARGRVDAETERLVKAFQRMSQ